MISHIAPRSFGRVKRALVICSLASGIAGCAAETDDVEGGDATSHEEEAFVPPERVTIRLDTAIIRPWDASEELWDDSQKVSPEEIAALGEALGVPQPYGAVAALVADLAIDHYAPPDPFGYAEVLVDGIWEQRLALGTPETNLDNVFTPLFDAGSWAGLRYDDALRVSITLVDEDDGLTGSDDPIGTVVLDADDLLEALKSGGVYQVPVHDQGLGTILFVGITVAEG